MKTEKEIRFALEMVEDSVKVKRDEIERLEREDPFEETINLELSIINLKQQIAVFKYVLDIE
jgi:hypothetical protein